ncbi:hypothetical protein pqer_cds_263 [Pandoravirus quercus]|uniref:Uncharacterized protein n=1 Tax=Pandoravirus quercus TaxID=2107709 RepID=A0A2U7U8H5_9VIRU|nr:hypothetical protein pqer_cds_263 [Pandoravirus quercus]AVK74685.1 hypothetical protein pqer_cds_263 [Pandoravirus quercus]
MQPNIAAAAARQRAAERGAGAPRGRGRGVPSVSTAPVVPGRTAGRLAVLLPRPAGAPAPPPQPSQQPQYREPTAAEIDAWFAAMGPAPEELEEGIETEMAMRRATPGPVTEQDMIDFFRQAGRDPNEPADVEVPYPDGQSGPQRYSICAEAIANRWSGFIGNLLRRMEDERRQTPTSVSGQFGLALTELLSQNQFYGIGYTVDPAANAVLVPTLPPSAPGQPAPAPQLLVLTPPAASGINQAAETGAGSLVDYTIQMIDSVATEGGRTEDEVAAELLGLQPPSTPEVQVARRALDDAIASTASRVAGPLVAAIAQQAQEAQMRSMMGQFPVGPPTPPTPPQPALVREVTEQEANDRVEANIEGQQARTAAAQAQIAALPTPGAIPSVSALVSGPTSPAAVGAVTPRGRAARQPSPGQIAIALQQAIVEGGEPRRRPTRRGVTAPTTPQTGAPAVPARYATAPPSPFQAQAAATLAGGAPPLTPLQVLAQPIIATGEPLNTQAQGVPTPPVVQATSDGLLEVVESEINDNLLRRVMERLSRGGNAAVVRATNTLARIRDRYQRDRDPQSRHVTENAMASVLRARGVPSLTDDVLDYITAPGERGRDEAEQLAQRLQEAIVEAEPQPAPTGRATGRVTREQVARATREAGARRTRTRQLNNASDAVTANSAGIIERITPDLADGMAMLVDGARSRGFMVSDDLAQYLVDNANNLAAVAVNGVSDALKDIATTDAEAAGGQGPTPGTQ